MTRSLLLAAAGFVAASAAPLPTLTLNNGVAIPRMLLGTGGGGGGYNVSAWLEVAAALGTGFDTAYTYCYNSAAPFCSHVSIYNAVAQAGLSPSSLFYISKTEPEDFGPAAYMSGFGRVVDRGILQDMAIPRVDMLMAHQAGRHSTDNNFRPPCFNLSAAGPAGPGTYAGCRVEMMEGFLAIQKAGLARSVAVSNWQVRELQQVFDATGVFPAANEIEVHPYWHEDDTIAFCKKNGIVVVNYAPVSMNNAALMKEPAVVAAAAAHGVTPAQVVIRWGLQYTGGVSIPRSHDIQHMRDNVAVFGFALTDAEMTAMSSYPQRKIFNVYCQPWC
jgi:diketogulonate reductase-like aldo/keto reductase